MVEIKHIREGHHTMCELLDILQAFVHHYEKVFTMHGSSEAWSQALQTCLDVTPKRISPEQYAFCEQKLTLADLKEAIFSIANDKPLVVMASLVNSTRPFGRRYDLTCIRSTLKHTILTLWAILLISEISSSYPSQVTLKISIIGGPSPCWMSPTRSLPRLSQNFSSSSSNCLLWTNGFYQILIHFG